MKHTPRDVIIVGCSCYILGPNRCVNSKWVNCWVVPKFHSGNKQTADANSGPFSPPCAILRLQPSPTADACQQSCFCTNLLLSANVVCVQCRLAIYDLLVFTSSGCEKKTWQDPEGHTSKLNDRYVRWRQSRPAEQNKASRFPSQPYIQHCKILTPNACDRLKKNPHI